MLNTACGKVKKTLIMLSELKTFLIAMTPIGELRVSIPVALNVYKLPVWSAYLFSVLGNIVPAVFWLWLLDKISRRLSQRFKIFHHIFDWLFSKTRKDHHSKFERFKEFALIILVAIPLPLTGVWTASLAAFVFGIPFKRALSFIAIGAAIAGLIVLLGTLGLTSYFK